MEYNFSFISLLSDKPSRSNTDYRHFAKLWTLAAIMETSYTFGNKNQFAILCRPCPDVYNYESDSKMAICHLIIDNKFIGNYDEECYLPTWFSGLVRFRNFIEENRANLYLDSFYGLTDRQIFELIIKSNQLEDEFDKNYLYLPQLPNIVWQRHYLTLDETIDAFIICYYVKEDKISFIVEKWWPEGLNRNRSNFFYKTINLNQFFLAIDEAITFIEANYSYLKI